MHKFPEGSLHGWDCRSVGLFGDSMTELRFTWCPHSCRPRSVQWCLLSNDPDLKNAVTGVWMDYVSKGRCCSVEFQNVSKTGYRLQLHLIRGVCSFHESSKISQIGCVVFEHRLAVCVLGSKVCRGVMLGASPELFFWGQNQRATW